MEVEYKSFKDLSFANEIKIMTPANCLSNFNYILVLL